MPELPEVEVTRLSFGPRILGGRVTAVRLGKPLRWPLGCAGRSLLGQTVGEVIRRGKYLWLPLESGGLLMHLGMSGSLRFADSVAPPGAHDHFDLVTTRGTLRLTDPRRFGAVVWSPAHRRRSGRPPAVGSGTRTLRSGLQRRNPSCRNASQERSGQARAAGGRHRRRRRQHLRLRGTVRRRHRPAHAQQHAQPAPLRASRHGGSRHAGTGTGARWLDAARLSTTRTAWPATSRTRLGSTAAQASPAVSAARACAASCSRSARATSARVASAADGECNGQNLPAKGSALHAAPRRAKLCRELAARVAALPCRGTSAAPATPHDDSVRWQPRSP